MRRVSLLALFIVAVALAVPAPAHDDLRSLTAVGRYLRPVGQQRATPWGHSVWARWSSAFSSPQWLAVDLGGFFDISRAVLRWERAFASTYEIQVSNDLALRGAGLE